MDLPNLTDWLKLRPSHYFALAVVTGMLVLGPPILVQRLGLQPVVREYRPWIGVAFLLFVALWLVHGAGPAIEWAKRKEKQRRLKNTQLATLESLTPAEKQILRRYIAGNTQTITLDMSRGEHARLEAHGIIYRPSSVSRAFTNFDFNLQPWAWDHLRKNPELLRKE